MNEPGFMPKTVCIIYIASTPEKVWEALTSAEFTRQSSSAGPLSLSRKSAAILFCACRMAVSTSTDASPHGIPPRRLSVTWAVDFEEFRGLPESLVTYEIEPMGESVKLTVTEAFQWDVQDAILAGGRQGWPFILSSLKSVLETGRPIAISVKMGPPKGMLEAIKEAVAKKPWRVAG